MTPTEAHHAAISKGLLPMWTIYDKPTDFPSGFIARMHVVGNGVSGPTSATITGSALNEVRDQLPPGLHNIGPVSNRRAADRRDVDMTELQHKVLIEIERNIDRTGISPSMREIVETLGLSSTSVAHRAVNGLEAQGYIRRLPHKARAVEVLMPVSRFAFYLFDDESKELRRHEPGGGNVDCGDMTWGICRRFAVLAT